LPPGATSADQCPVDHTTRLAWLDSQKAKPEDSSSASGRKLPALFSAVVPQTPGTRVGETSAAGRQAVEAQRAAALSKAREVSSIPRAGRSGYNGGEGEDGDASSPTPAPSAASPSAHAPSEDEPKGTDGNWVYPSPAQFYSAMARKNHQPSADDMPIVVSIHNAVNERAWQEILAWERGWAGLAPVAAEAEAASPTSSNGKGAADRLRWKEPAEACGGLKLVSFIGKPNQLTWRAWGRSILGYETPFDRHDWIVDRCGTQVRYIIDFYTGRPTVAARTAPSGQPVQNLAFYLDVRPAPDSVEGWAMRFHRTWLRLTGNAPLPGAS